MPQMPDRNLDETRTYVITGPFMSKLVHSKFPWSNKKVLDLENNSFTMLWGYVVTITAIVQYNNTRIHKLFCLLDKSNLQSEVFVLTVHLILLGCRPRKTSSINTKDTWYFGSRKKKSRVGTTSVSVCFKDILLAKKHVRYISFYHTIFHLSQHL